MSYKTTKWPAAHYSHDWLGQNTFTLEENLFPMYILSLSIKNIIPLLNMIHMLYSKSSEVI